jgi:hypothetical protein
VLWARAAYHPDWQGCSLPVEVSGQRCYTARQMAQKTKLTVFLVVLALAAIGMYVATFIKVAHS